MFMLMGSQTFEHHYLDKCRDFRVGQAEAVCEVSDVALKRFGLKSKL